MKGRHNEIRGLGKLSLGEPEMNENSKQMILSFSATMSRYETQQSKQYSPKIELRWAGARIGGADRVQRGVRKIYFDVSK